ncbi:PHP domain-containing protein [Microbacterium sp. NPDC087665]|uniref:PHP domain-containing protein n=1 Tax=Microbacterium sp. NPDC087665 TaxID=3364194 RepID=UPI0038144B47
MTDLLRGDHHVHSTFSDDAVSTPEENVAAAVAAGLTTLRIVDHVRRDTTWVPEYVAAIDALVVPEGLTLLTGVEAKVLDTAGTLDIPDLPRGIDRILIADHQFPGAAGPLGPTAVREKMAEGWAADDVLDDFVTAMIAAMERHPGNQLAHCFSLLPKIGLAESDLGAERLTAWSQAAARTGTLVEINEKWGCPEPSSLAALRAAGAEVVASTDSHEAATVGRYARVRELLSAESTS